MKNSIKSFFSNKQGLALIEFALFLPLLLLMFFGVVEFTRYVIITQKSERSAYALSNIMSQFTPIKAKEVETEASTTTLDEQVFAQFSRTMDVYNVDSDRIAIISSITKTSNGNNNASVKINWQRAGGGSLASSEAVSMLNGVNAADINSASANGSTAGTSPTFPGYTGQLMHNALSDMDVGENMIVTEIFYRYQPFMGSVLGSFGSAAMPAAIMKAVVFSRPRNGDISTLERPKAGTDPTIEFNGSTTDTCTTVKLQPTYLGGCVYTTVKTETSCETTVKCTTCTDKQVCKKCTTPFNGAQSCNVYLDVFMNCTPYQRTYSCTPTSGGPITPSSPPASLPPS